MPTRWHPQLDWIVTPEYYVGISVAYLAGIYILNDFVSAYKYEFDGPFLKQIMRLYNLGQVLLCSYMVYLLSADFKLSLNSNFIADFYGLHAPFTKRAEYALLIHFFSKIIDFLDTIFMILRRKHRQLTFLHIFHHTTIVTIWGIVVNSGYGGSTAGWGAMANSFIHVLMYSHYLVSSFGIRNPLKRYLTIAQLTQFVLCFIHSFFVMFASSYPKDLASIQTVFQLCMLYLFGKFYMESYTKKKGGKKGKKPAGAPVTPDITQEPKKIK